MNPKVFRIEHWKELIHEHLELWSALQGVFRTAQESGPSSETLPQTGTNGVLLWVAQLKSMQDAQNIPSLMDLFSRQMHIVAGSLIDGILGDAFFLVFQQKPELMKSKFRGLPDEDEPEQERRNGSNMIRFDEVLRFSSREELIDSLAEGVARTQNQGKIEKILKRFLTVSGWKSEPSTFAAVREIMELRHKSAHETAQLSLPAEKIESVFLNILPGFLDDIEEILASCGVFSDRDVEEVL